MLNIKSYRSDAIHFKVFLSAVAVLLCLKSAAVFGAEIRIGQRLIDGSDHPFDTIIIEGPIKRGDAKRLQTLIQSNVILPALNISLSLDSSGGDFLEAVDIAKLVHSSGMRTYIGDGAECYSSCAFVFMFGRTGTHYGTWPNRILHPNGKLGFHAPYLDLGEIHLLMEGAQIEEVFNQALLTISELNAINNRAIPQKLWSDLLKIDRDNLLFITDLGDLFQYEISLESNWEPSTLTREGIARACRSNWVFRNLGERAHFYEGYDHFESWLNFYNPESDVKLRNMPNNGIRYIVPADIESGSVCVFDVAGDNESSRLNLFGFGYYQSQDQIRVSDQIEMDISWMWTLPLNTQISHFRK